MDCISPLNTPVHGQSGRGYKEVGGGSLWQKYWMLYWMYFVCCRSSLKAPPAGYVGELLKESLTKKNLASLAGCPQNKLLYARQITAEYLGKEKKDQWWLNGLLSGIINWTGTRCQESKSGTSKLIPDKYWQGTPMRKPFCLGNKK